MSNIVRSDSSKQKLHLYCRLCALLKPSRVLVNLQDTEKRRKYVMGQLARLNICVTNLDSEHDTLPKRICTLCIGSLDRAYNFAMNVEKGQEVLNMHILAQNFRTDDSQSLRESSDLPSIVERNGGMLILSPSSIQAIVDRSSKRTDAYHNQSTIRQDSHFLDKNVNEDKPVRSKNNSSISLLTTGGSNINELQKDINSTDKIDMEINSDVHEFAEEYKVTVTEYQITKSKPGSNFTTECSNINKLDIQLPMDTTDEVQGEKIPGICFDFEEENIDENVDNDDNCFEILRTKTNLTCNAKVNSKKVLIDFKKKIEEDSELIKNTTPTGRIDPSDSHKENAVTIATGTNNVITTKRNVNQSENLDMHKMHTDDLIVKQEEASSDDEVKYEELETLKQNVFNDYIRGTPVVVLNRISDADSSMSKTDLYNNIKHGPGRMFKSNKSQSQKMIRNGFRKDSKDLVISDCMSWEKYRWKCASCEETFPHIDKLIEHMKEQHGYCNFYQCTECNSQSHILDNFIKHLQHHKEQLKFSCFKCFRTYPNPNSVHLHYKMHAKSEITCLGCHETFSKKEDLERHCKKYKMKSVEANYSVKKYADSLTCNICHKKCANLHILLQHLEKSHSVQRKHYTCKKCGKIYYELKSLISHMKIHDVLYTSHCKLCIELFQNAHDLHSHIYSVHGERPYICDECGKAFKTTITLQKHFLIHMREFTQRTK